MSFQPAIKWSGSKRSQSREIVSYFPSKINTYYEPFVGGGSVLYALLTSDKKVERYICSDVNKDLIMLWNEIKSNYLWLHRSYTEMWEELNIDDDIDRRKEYYYMVRERFNKYRRPSDFMFINRTCTNGLIRYNKNGDFNSSFHFSRKGITPENLFKILEEWSKLLNANDVQFILSDYQKVKTVTGDIVYADPPYAATKGMYYGVIDYIEFFEWVGSQAGNVLFSFDGKRGDQDYTYEVPSTLYKEHIYIKSGVSSFTRLKTRSIEDVYESLYIT